MYPRSVSRYCLIVCVLLVSLGGCDSSTESITFNPFTSLAPFNPIILGLVDADVDAVVLALFTEYSGYLNVPIMEFARATFTTEDGTFYPGSVKVNGDTLARNAIYEMFFTHLSDSANIKWEVIGYDNGNFYDTTTYPPELSITGLKAFDTVSKSLGFTAPYTGSDSAGTIIAYARFDPGITQQFGTGSSEGSGATGKSAPDSGSVTFTPQDLSSFTESKYITVEVIRFRYHVGYSSTGHKIGVLSERTATLPLYLKP